MERGLINWKVKSRYFNDIKSKNEDVYFQAKFQLFIINFIVSYSERNIIENIVFVRWIKTFDIKQNFNCLWSKLPYNQAWLIEL